MIRDELYPVLDVGDLAVLHLALVGLLEQSTGSDKKINYDCAAACWSSDNKNLSFLHFIHNKYITTLQLLFCIQSIVYSLISLGTSQ